MDSITNTANNESLVRVPKAGNLLKNIQSPTDLKKLSPVQLREVSDELRQFIIDIVSVHGGHLRLLSMLCDLLHSVGRSGT